MKRPIAGKLILIALAAALLLFLADTRALQSSVWDHLGLLVDVRHQLVHEYVVEPDQQTMVEEAVRGMIRSLDDPHTTYLSEEDLPGFEKNMTGRFTGIGAMIEPFENRLRIVTPLEGSPAWKAGVLAGDVILDIEGQTTEDMKPEQAVDLLTGEADTQVTIRVRHEMGEEQQISITRSVIEINTVRGLIRDPDQHYNYLLDDVRRIGYVRITQFTDQTVPDVEQVLTELRDAGLRAMILDLRFDPGGLLDAAVAISDMFLEADRGIVTIKGRAVPETAHKATENTLLPKIPIVVLANGASASAAEIVTGALADNERALFVGTRTFGKGSVQTVKRLEDHQGALKITNAYYYLPSGRNIHRHLPENGEEELWGVDPSPGAWVAMSPTEIEQMIRVRRERDRVQRSNGTAVAEISPEWIEQELKDPQLAAALRAIHGMLETGQWPQVGDSGVEELIKIQKRQSLQRRRDLLHKSLGKIDEELQKLTEAPSDADADTHEGSDTAEVDTTTIDSTGAAPEAPNP